MTSQASQNSYNFKIVSNKEISKNFLERGISDFEGAVNFTGYLPFRRNKNKEDLTSLFSENCGTCGTKHALLRQLAIENSNEQVKLKLGIFKMTAVNTPPVAATLKKHGLDYLPEAHNYLSIANKILDCTWDNKGIPELKNYLLSEIEIEPKQITDFKVAHHKAFLQEWLKEQGLDFSLEEIWLIREQCIRDLSI